MKTEIIKLKLAVSQIAGELAYTLRHLSKPEDITQSDTSHMEQIAERLDKLAEELGRQ